MLTKSSFLLGSDRTPYTYRVVHKPSGRYYYGLRIAKGCHPKDLFVTYTVPLAVSCEIYNGALQRELQRLCKERDATVDLIKHTLDHRRY